MRKGHSHSPCFCDPREPIESQCPPPKGIHGIAECSVCPECNNQPVPLNETKFICTIKETTTTRTSITKTVENSSPELVDFIVEIVAIFGVISIIEDILNQESTTQPTEDSDSLSSLSIAGIVLGSLAATGLVISLVVYCYNKKSNKK